MREREKREDQPLLLTEKTFPIIEQITTGMPGGFFIYRADESEELIYANRALVEMYGCDDLEDFRRFTGSTFSGMIHPEDREKTFESIHKQIVTEGGSLDYIEYRIIRKDGSIRWIDDYGHFVHTETFGDIFYVFLVDATEKYLRQLIDEKYVQLARERVEALERLEHETTALRLVHDILRSGMWSMDFDRTGAMIDVQWSSEFRAMIGYRDQEDFPDRLESWSDLLHPEDKERVLKEYYDTIADYSGKKLYDVEYRLLTRNRGYRWFRATGKLSRRRDGTPITYVGMFVDITVRKEKDRKLVEQHRMLEEALEKAQQASRAKTMFLNNMSHDIRTPMNAIIGFTSLASSHMEDPAQVRNYLDKIMASSQHLLSLLNDVLDMSRIESGKVVIKDAPCDLRAVLEELRTISRADVQSQELDFAIDDAGLLHPWVVCDRLRLNQALLNVTSNAIKFTPAGGQVRVRLEESGEAPDGQAAYRFTVQDTGIGMSREFLQRIFEPFERERTSTVSGIQGTGLGMTITRNLVELMGGTIGVESQAGKGTLVTLTFRFPLCQKSGGPGVPAAPAAKGGQLGELLPEESFRGKHILLVEDNELNREIALTILEEAGLTVDTAANGAEAVELVADSAANPYQLVLMDIQMPVLDGYGAAQAIRALADPALASVPILTVTANVFEEDRQKAREAGMNGHLSKPIDIDRLMDALHGILG